MAADLIASRKAWNKARQSGTRKPPVLGPAVH